MSSSILPGSFGTTGNHGCKAAIKGVSIILQEIGFMVYVLFVSEQCKTAESKKADKPCYYLLPNASWAFLQRISSNTLGWH